MVIVDEVEIAVVITVVVAVVQVMGLVETIVRIPTNLEQNKAKPIEIQIYRSDCSKSNNVEN